MFGRLLINSFSHRRSRKALAVLTVWIGISLITGLLTLGLDVGDKMNRELQSYGANIRLAPAAAAIPLQVGGHDLSETVKPEYLNEADLNALHDIFWTNNLVGISARLWTSGQLQGNEVPVLGVHFDVEDAAGPVPSPAREFYSHWRVSGDWPVEADECLVGADAARELGLAAGSEIAIATAAGATPMRVTGIVSSGGAEDSAVIASLPRVQEMAGAPGKISEADIRAITTPENKLAEKYKLDPTGLTPEEYERWACTSYPGSVAADIQEGIPGSAARVVRRVAETQGVALTRVQGLVALLGVLGAMACVLNTMGVLTSAVLDRRAEVALMRAIGAHRGSVLRLFLSEAAAIGIAGGLLAGGTGYMLGQWLVQLIFGAPADSHFALFFFAPLLGLLTALAASALPILHTLRQNPVEMLHEN